MFWKRRAKDGWGGRSAGSGGGHWIPLLPRWQRPSTVPHPAWQSHQFSPIKSPINRRFCCFCFCFPTKEPENIHNNNKTYKTSQLVRIPAECLISEAGQSQAHPSKCIWRRISSAAVPQSAHQSDPPAAATLTRNEERKDCLFVCLFCCSEFMLMATWKRALHPSGPAASHQGQGQGQGHPPPSGTQQR